MLRFETLDEKGGCVFEMKGKGKIIGIEAAYMMTLIYKGIYKEDPAAAREFRRTVLYAINGAYDAVERGDI